MDGIWGAVRPRLQLRWSIALVLICILSDQAYSQNLKPAETHSDAQARCLQKLGKGAVAEKELDFGEVTFVCNCGSPYQWNASKTRCEQEGSGKSLDSGNSNSANQELVHACDRLAAHPDDPEKKATGVSWWQLKKTADKAIEACRSAVRHDGDEVRFKVLLGRALLAKNDYTKALPFIREGVDAGNAVALEAEALLYLDGSGGEKSGRMAFLRFKAAADKGLTSSMAGVASLYERGIGTKKSLEDAVLWFKEAAHAGHVNAMYELALKYREGLGVQKNIPKAVSWYRKSALHGNTDAVYTLAVLHQLGLGVDKDYKKSAELMFRALQLKNKTAIEEMATNGAAAGKQFIIELQIILRLEGFYDGAIDGSFNPKTSAAIRKLAGQ